MKEKRSSRFWCALTLFSLVGQIAWVVENMYLNVFIYKMFRASAADISAMVAASAIAATLTTVFIGALSDKMGKRKLFICGGYILWGISILCFSLLRLDVIDALFPSAVSSAAVGVSLVITLDCVMTFFGSSANDAAFNAWLTDNTDSTNRGAAEGINAMMPLVAILAVFGGFMAFDLNRAESWTWIFLIIGTVVLIVGIIGCFLLDDTRTVRSENGYFQNVLYGFKPSTAKAHVSLYFYLLAFILFNISIQIFMPYLILYYEVSLGMTDYVLIMAPAIILASVATALWGKVYDKKGFSFAVWFALLSLVLGYVLLGVFRTAALVFLGSLLMMCGYLCGMAVFGAKIRDLTPRGKAGMLQGVRIFSQVLIPGIAGPFIGKTVLANAETIVNNDGTESFVPNANIFWAALAVAVVLILLLLLIKGEKPRLCRLHTPFEENTDSDWATEYPRPQMKRASFFTLCGEWHLFVKKATREKLLGSIRVPFPPESRLSGIERTLKRGESYVYRKSFTLPVDFLKGRVLLHFGAVDQIARVTVNRRFIGEHIGGYLPFTFDITSAVTMGHNTITVEVQDPLNTDLPYGKQRRSRGGMWYTPISGIWQSVWIESVPQNYVEDLHIQTTENQVTIEVIGGDAEKTLTLHLPDSTPVYHFYGNRITIPIANPICWTPEQPHLYEFTLSAGEDTVQSYFALRTVSIAHKGNRSCICLNGTPYFCHGLLDQGYYSDGIYLPATPEGYRFDILTMKQLGFNTLRKHIKIEPDVFYYYCDKYGMLVFQDMVNSGKYHFLLDTALPTIGLKRGISHHATQKRRTQFERDAADTALLLYNHPSVCYYTIFNEGWGQYDADRIYDDLRDLDPSRVWDATSGWFAEQRSDVDSEHVYFRKLDLKASEKRPLVLSEFGGYSCKIPEHAFNLDKTYGYRFFDRTDDLEQALEALYRDEVLPMLERGLCAAILTQVSDVEDETNGLLTYDRRVLKVTPQRMTILAAELQEKFRQVWRL